MRSYSKNLPIELMRWVTDNKIDDEEINWLIDTALARKANGKNYLMLTNILNIQMAIIMTTKSFI